ncbi:hypothetical protein [Streptosporangium amethystogenes]|uniref:hypothetical protein n=1 Tax=Streptosporangium amethystogenes TaxID=2002 RepID=UPI0012FC897A
MSRPPLSFLNGILNISRALVSQVGERDQSGLGGGERQGFHQAMGTGAGQVVLTPRPDR